MAEGIERVIEVDGREVPGIEKIVRINGRDVAVIVPAEPVGCEIDDPRMRPHWQQEADRKATERARRTGGDR